MPGLESIRGIDIFYMLASVAALIGIQTRTKSFAFTGLVILICGGSLLALFPMAWIKIAFAMAMLAFTGLLMKIFQDQ